jgi:hypothetical protein
VGSQTPYQPHKLIVGLLYANDCDHDTALGVVEQAFGSIDARTEPMPFRFTDYYDDEMRGRPMRMIVSIDTLVDPSDLARMKVIGNRLEAERSRTDGSRRLNLDPGLLSLSRLILATTKPSAHRIAIGEGIFAELTLLYRHGRYEPFEWTYPDFRSDVYHEWLLGVRGRYHDQLREIDPDRAWRL